MRRSCIPLLALLVACGGSRFVPLDEAIGPARDELTLAKHELTPSERDTLDRSGFAILANAPANSFHVGYTALFHAHKPVYVTADSLLYAWHTSYDGILISLERTELIPRVTQLVGELRTKLAAAHADAETRSDLDTYLAVAQALLDGKPATPAVAELVAHATAAQGTGTVDLFGSQMDVDWSMFKPRGHYDGWPDLEHYFRAMSWLGRIELRIANKVDGEWRVDHRAFAAAQLLASLFDAPTRARWQAIDDTLSGFVGPQDSMSVPGLTAGLAMLPANATNLQIVVALRDRAKQRIQTQLVYGSDRAIAFVLLGQRFVVDSQVFGSLVYDALRTEPERLMPTPLDVGHAVFHNPAAHELLGPDIARYGAPYEAALAKATRDVDADPALWTSSLYHLWLGALRTLSPDAQRDAKLPAPLTGTAWARRILATQLASWAELRHDTLLYAKQSETVELGCEYPDGYIDPYPEFYAQMAAIAARGKTLTRDADVVAYFDRMTRTMERLRSIAERERANQPLTESDLDFLNHMVSITGKDGGCTTTYVPEGWYADLFFERGKAMFHEPIVADVHTQPTDEAGNEVGRVLHVGTGMPHMLIVNVAHDGGEHAQTYRGFVASYREVVTEHYQRLTDEDWQQHKDTRTIVGPTWLDGMIAR